MQHVDDEQVERHPRQVEEGGRSGAGDKAPDLVEVADRLHAGSLVACPQRQEQRGRESLAVQLSVERVADADEKPQADEVEQAVDRVEPDHDDGDADQRRHALRGQHPVIDLQHVERAGQAEDVDHAGEDADAQQRPAQMPERGPQLIARCRCGCRSCHDVSNPMANIATNRRKRRGREALIFRKSASLRLPGWRLYRRRALYYKPVTIALGRFSGEWQLSSNSLAAKSKPRFAHGRRRALPATARTRRRRRSTACCSASTATTACCTSSAVMRIRAGLGMVYGIARFARFLR